MFLDEPLESVDLRQKHAVTQLLVELRRTTWEFEAIQSTPHSFRRYAHRVLDSVTPTFFGPGG